MKRRQVNAYGDITLYNYKLPNPLKLRTWNSIDEHKPFSQCKHDVLFKYIFNSVADIHITYR